MSNLDTSHAEARQWYLSNFEWFENSLNGSGDTPFHEMRKTAIARFAELGFPTPRNEEWKYTNVAPILQHKFKLAAGTGNVNKKGLAPFLFKGVKENLLVFVNGYFLRELSVLQSTSSGLVIDNLKDTLQNRSEATRYLGRIAKFENDSFTALNTAFASEGVLVVVPDGQVVADPIHIINLAHPEGASFVSYPRNLFVVGQSSQVQIIESFHHLSNNAYFNNVVSEIVLHDNAIVDHLKIQDESEAAYHVANTQVSQQRDSVYTSVNVDLGGALVRNNLNVLLDGENSETHLFGFYLAGGTQHIDNHTFMDHARPHCHSNELFKGILDGKARAVFNGKILVRPDAQKTNALQSNKTLLLTDDASINTKPQLEIFADDVKCTHGATIGQLDEEALFYLRARGIGEELAAAMLRYAFVGDVFEHIKIESVRKALEKKIIDRLQVAGELRWRH
ncbi:MAG: Fe-S cluster assembly protein SufD [bacterium]